MAGRPQQAAGPVPIKTPVGIKSDARTGAKCWIHSKSPRHTPEVVAPQDELLLAGSLLHPLHEFAELLAGFFGRHVLDIPHLLAH
jgi:hypothetical protein